MAFEAPKKYIPIINRDSRTTAPTRLVHSMGLLLIALYMFFNGCSGAPSKDLSKSIEAMPPIRIEWLGAKVQEVPNRIANYYSMGAPRGAVVTGVDENGPARKAGLEWGDIILSLDDVELSSPQDLLEWSGVLDRNQTTLGILRAGSHGKIEIILREEEKQKRREITRLPQTIETTETKNLNSPALRQNPIEKTISNENNASFMDAKIEELPETKTDKTNPSNILENTEKLEAEAYALFLEGKNNESLQAYEAVTRADPSNFQALNNMGAALNQLGRQNEALTAFEAALTINPGFSQAHFNRGLTLWNLGRFEEAVIAYRSAASLLPNLIEASSAEADALMQLDRSGEALAANDRAVQFGGSNADIWRQRGDIYKRLERIDEAEEAYLHALDISPNNPESLLSLAILMDESNQQKKALELLDQLIENNGKDATAFHNRALTKMHLGDINGAIGDAAAAIALEPEFSAAYAVKAQALSAAGKFNESIIAWGNVLESDPRNTQALNRLSELAEELSSSKRGIKQIQSWLMAFGEDPGAQDGVMGEKVSLALQGFQREAGLNPTGRLNGTTLLRLIINSREKNGLEPY